MADTKKDALATWSVPRASCLMRGEIEAVGACFRLALRGKAQYQDQRQEQYGEDGHEPSA